MSDGTAAGDGSLVGKVALVTGAGRGIGRATALALADRGADVVAVARTTEQIKQTAALVRERGRKGQAVAADVADWPAVERTVAATLQAFGRIDVLVSNAGMLGPIGQVWELDPAGWHKALDTNVLGPFHFMRAVVPGMVQRRSGVVINVSSGSTRIAATGRSAYGSGKAAVNQLTLIAAAEAAPFRVRVHVVYPGLTASDLVNEMRSAPGLSDEDRAGYDRREQAGEIHPPEEPGFAIAWLASPAGARWTEVLFNVRDPAAQQAVAGG